MAPSRRKGASKAAAAAAARRKWKVGDLVLAKVKGFPAWPATVSEPEKWGYSTDLKKVLVYFFGTQQIAFCNPADVEAFTEEKKQSLLVKRQGKGADFVRAVQEIIASYEKSKKSELADVINSGDEVNGGNSVDSSKNISKDEEEVPTETLELDSKPFGDKREPCLPIEDVVKQAESLHEKDSVQEKLTESLVVAESLLLAIYTSRKRSGGSRQENSVPQRRALPVRRSRSSSRVESGQFQNFVVSNNDGSKVGGNIVANGARDGSVRRNKLNSRKSPDILDCDDRGSLALAHDISAEDNGSDTVSVESDSLGVNVGNILDSGSKPQNSETVGMMDGGSEFSKGLDLQVKAGVMKKRRKPNRKQSMNEANENIARLQKDAGLNGEENDTDQNSHHICEKTNESESMEDGDEHLPLVKRARVRMGKISSVEEPSGLPQVEEKAPDDVSASSLGQNSLALTRNSNDTLDRSTFLVKGTSGNTSPSKGGTQYSGNQTHFWKVKKKLLLCCSADGEAALPPSKRLLRALEAMSANAAEEEQRCITALTKNSSINGCCVSPTSRCPDMTVENREGNGSGSRSVDYSAKSAIQIGASGFFTSLNPMSSGGVDISDTPIEFFERKGHEFDKDSAAETTGIVEGSDPIGSPAGTDAVQMVVNCGSPESLLCSAVMGQANPTSNQVSFNQLLPSQDESDGKELDISEHDIPSANIVQGIGEANKVSPGDDAKMHEHCSCGTGCENVVSLKSQVDGSCQVNGSCEAVSDRVELKEEQKGTSSAFVSSDDCTSEKIPSDVLSSPHPTVGIEFPAQLSPSTLTCHIPTTESANDRLEQNISFVTPVVGEGKGESVTQKTVLFSKWGNHAEAQAALPSFEAILGTLTGKKEIIGRATRVAIECGKLGLAAKVMEILTRNLESETSLHRRVDLFFLVDSITQCSRNMRGDVGGMFLSAIQMLLPRLLSAAAPPGSTAQENLRQCLKVLRVWLDRKILPDSVVRHHIRELEFHGGASSAGVYSRRSSRTERSLDDPVREMEGMLVDEYGSNSSFQLPGFCMPRMRKDEDEGSDSDGGSFEAVTPEHKPDTPEEQETSNIGEKHRHILEDVDGELEMEDVAPLCDVEMNASKNEYLQSSHDGSDQPIPPSAPPPPPSPSLPPPCAMSKSYSASVDSNIYAAKNNMLDNSGQPMPPHSVASRINPRDKQMHRQIPDPAGSYPIRSGNNGARFYSKPYLPRPPHPAPPDQFSYVQHAKSRREASFPNRYHNNTGGGKFYNNHDRMKHTPYENGDNWRRHAPLFPGPRYADKGKTSYPHAGPSREPTRFQNQEWRAPPRAINHRNSLPMRHPSEGPKFWQPSR